MPSATDEQRELMKRWFGDEIDDRGPIQFLLSRGYTTIAGMWQKPTPSHTITLAEQECLNFLCNEWDYGYNFVGLSNHTEPAQQSWVEPDGTTVFRSYKDYCNG